MYDTFISQSGDLLRPYTANAYREVIAPCYRRRVLRVMSNEYMNTIKTMYSLETTTDADR